MVYIDFMLNTQFILSFLIKIPLISLLFTNWLLVGHKWKIDFHWVARPWPVTLAAEQRWHTHTRISLSREYTLSLPATIIIINVL